MPGFTDVAAYVHVSTYKTWEDVARWYRGLVKEQLQPSPPSSDAVMDAVKGLDRRARARSARSTTWWCSKTRYVGLEFGIHGYQPYRTTQVFARKFGDCKDKASLLVVMLREIGVEASLVLARTRHGGDLDARAGVAGAVRSRHRLCAQVRPVPRRDGRVLRRRRAAGAGPGHPGLDRARRASCVRTPVLPAERNRVATEQAVTLDASGAAQGRRAGHRRRRGGARVALRTISRRASGSSATARRGRRSTRARASRRSTCRRSTISSGRSRCAPRVDVPDWARAATARGGELVMPALGREADMLRRYARLSSRKHDLVLGFPWRQEDRVTVALPRGLRVKRLPEARTVEAPFGRFTLSGERQGRRGRGGGGARGRSPPHRARGLRGVPRVLRRRRRGHRSGARGRQMRAPSRGSRTVAGRAVAGGRLRGDAAAPDRAPIRRGSAAGRRGSTADVAVAERGVQGGRRATTMRALYGRALLAHERGDWDRAWNRGGRCSRAPRTIARDPWWGAFADAAAHKLEQLVGEVPGERAQASGWRARRRAAADRGAAAAVGDARRLCAPARRRSGGAPASIARAAAPIAGSWPGAYGALPRLDLADAVRRPTETAIAGGCARSPMRGCSLVLEAERGRAGVLYARAVVPRAQARDRGARGGRERCAVAALCRRRGWRSMRSRPIACRRACAA